MLLHRQLSQVDIVSKTDTITEYEHIIHVYGFMQSKINFELPPKSYYFLGLDKKINNIYCATTSGTTYVCFGEGDRFLYGTYISGTSLYYWSYVKSTSTFNTSKMYTFSVKPLDYYVYGEYTDKGTIKYYFETGPVSKDINGQSERAQIIDLHYKNYYDPQFGFFHYNSSTINNYNSYTYLNNINVGYNTDDFGGIDLSLDARPIRYIDEDGSAIQLVTERCIKNANAFDMDIEEVTIDNTRLVTERNILNPTMTMEEKTIPDWITVKYTDEIEQEEKQGFFSNLVSKVKSFLR